MARGECVGATPGSQGNEVRTAFLQSNLWNKAINLQCPAVTESSLALSICKSQALFLKTSQESALLSPCFLFQSLKNAGETGERVGGGAGVGKKLWMITLSVTEKVQRMDYNNSA